MAVRARHAGDGVLRRADAVAQRHGLAVEVALGVLLQQVAENAPAVGVLDGVRAVAVFDEVRAKDDGGIDGDIAGGNGHRGGCLVAGQGVTGTRSAGTEVTGEDLVGRGRQRDGSVGKEVAVATMADAEMRTGNTAGDAADGTHVGGAGFGGAMTVIAYRAVVVVGDNVSVIVRTSYEDFEKVEIGSDVGAIAEASAHGRRSVVIAHDATVVLLVYTVGQHELGSYGAVGDGT